MAYPYKPPSFLENQSADEIHRRMMNALPDYIDKSELQIPWDYTRPAAIEKAEFVQFELNEAIKLIFPHWAYGQWLDLHAQSVGIERRPANRAYGTVIVRATQGTVVSAGFQFATPANLTSSVVFEATETIAFDGEPDGRGQVTATVPIQAIEGGISGNVPPDSIKLMVKPEAGIVYVMNPEATTGGTPEESDDDLRERVIDAMRRGVSLVGCDSDYIRWAKEVPGVGQVIVDPEWDDPNLPEEFHWIDGNGRRRCAGAVRLFIIDANGLPANEQIIDAVYDHIISPNNRMNRIAPIGATLTVTAPTPLYIDITATITLSEGETIEAVTSRFKANLDAYWLQATTENDLIDVQYGNAQNSVKYVYIGSTLAETEGIANYDHNSLTVNGATDDIPITIGIFPVTREVTLNE